MKIWMVVVLGSVTSIALLWFTSLPLGIPGEWIWQRSAPEADFSWNLIGGVVAAGLYVTYVFRGWLRFEGISTSWFHRLEIAAWISGLVAISFVWFWIVQEVAPLKNRLGKSAFVLYYPSSSGYFTRVRFEKSDALSFLTRYEDLMRQGDVLHTGTHPPGLFLIFHGLIAACESSADLSFVLDVTQPQSFREAGDVIAANNLRRTMPQQLLPFERRVLWLATLLVMFSASLAVIPIYGLLIRCGSRSTAWLCSALWPAMPAVAIFIPKSDVVFPVIGTTILWLWLTAWDRRSRLLALFAGFVSWCGLMCSLAFLPVLLAAALLTIGSTVMQTIVAWFGYGSHGFGVRKSAHDATEIGTPGPRFESANDIPDTRIDTRNSITLLHWVCVMVAALGFVLPTFVLWRVAHVNLLNVWWLNYQNHAGFYQQYPRTYWKWLLVNPLELSFSAGWPMALLAGFTCWNFVWPVQRQGESSSRLDVRTVIGSIVTVWGLLWLTGKNSGEAARLWILFLPWLIWLGSIRFESMMSECVSIKNRQRQVLALLVIQFAVCLLTVARVSGFHSDPD